MCHSTCAFPLSRRAATLLLLVLGACGGGSTGTTPPAGSPASIAITAGDQQQAASGVAVPVAPAVLVRDAAQAPVAGATVHFSVTSGGGTITGANALTDGSGVARLGQWTLGPAGAQRLAAQVGSLAAVTFQATLSVAGTGGVEGTIGTGGGTIQITAAGEPYQGLQVTVPAGTFAASGVIRLRNLAGQSPPSLPTGYQAVGPMLEIATDQPRGAQLMTIDVPITRAPGTDVVLVMRDPSRGVMEVMPTVARTSTSIRVVTTHLRGDLLRGPGAQPGLLSTSRGFSVGQLIPVSMLVPVAPAGPVVAPSIGRWPVLDHGSAQAPNGFSAGLAALQSLAGTASVLLGNVVKPLATPGFYADKGPLAAAKIAQAEVQTSSGTFSSIFSALSTLSSTVRDELLHDNIVASLAIGGQPVPVALFGTGQAPALFATAIAGTAADLTLLNPAENAPVIWSRSVAAGYAALATHVTADQALVTVSTAIPVSSFTTTFSKISATLSDLASLAQSAATARRQKNDAMGASAGIPEVAVEVQSAPGGSFTPISNNTIVVRNSSTTIRVPSIGGGTTGWVINLPTTGAEVGRANGTDLPVTSLSNFAAIPDGVPTEMVVSPFARVGGLLRQMSAHLLTVTKAPFTVSPEISNFTAAFAPLTFTATVSSPPATGYLIEWDWGAGSTTVSRNTTTATHSYPEVKDYTVIATLFDEASGASLAADTVKVQANAVSHWRLTSITDPNHYLPLDPADDFADDAALRRLLASPGMGLISVSQQTVTTSELELRILTTPWDPTDPFPGVARRAGEFDFPLGHVPTEVFALGPFFTGWGTNFWTQSTTDLNSGTMTGQSNFGTMVYTVKDAGVQTGPSGASRFTATRTGTTMTGTISIWIWWVTEDEVLQDPPQEYRFPFTATRLR
ncbi:MAG: PKD domain-containing protein [Gemmatimonadetes bacterium]|nr:PKD domain-containing protein [Gemmatimonadota bacterium]